VKRSLAASAAAIFLLAAALSSASAEPLKDGVYFAQEGAYAKSGWKYQVSLAVQGGRIVEAGWNAVSNLGLADKKTVAASGGYGMVKASPLKKEWHEQAAAVEDYLVATQDLGFARYTTEAGNTDAIAGASIMVREFFVLAKEAVEAGPVQRGPYARDGWYYASAADYDASGWKANVLLTVAGGRIVDAVWNALPSERKKKSKLVEAAKGSYGMGKAAAQGEWHLQAERAVRALLAAQTPAAIPVKADGKTDAVSGVSMSVAEFLSLADTALKSAR
jgi:major membrane immunogen (membrane-anchored lipoprotein)